MSESEGVNLDEEISRGNQAKAILNDALFIESFDALKDTYMHAWENSTLADSHGRERIYMMVAAIVDVKKHLASIVDTGKMAQTQIAEELAQEDENLLDKKKLQSWGVRI